MLEPCSSRPASTGRRTAGTRRCRPASAPGTPSSSASTSSAFSAREPCIFQLPAINGRRIAVPRESSVVQEPSRPREGRGSLAAPCAAKATPRRSCELQASAALEPQPLRPTPPARSASSRTELLSSLALDHDADHRLRARGAQHDAAAARRAGASALRHRVAGSAGDFVGSIALRDPTFSSTCGNFGMRRGELGEAAARSAS